jgi:hypothetical protein
VSGFGAALAWSLRRGLATLDVLVEAQVSGVEGVPGPAGVISRRAAELASPPSVWEIHGRDLVVASPVAAHITGDAVGGDTEIVAELADLMRRHGVDPIIEHGVLRGDYLGLEVARVVAGRLQVGVGRHDRSARAEMRPGESLGDALDEVVSAVKARRRAGAMRHPANTLARGRWLRAVVCANPALVGAAELHPVAPPMPWFDLPEAGAAPCEGTWVSDGARLVAVCSVGSDVDLVPTAADCRAVHRPDADLLLVVPDGDDFPLVHEMSASLSRPARIVTVAPGWESLLAH